MKKKKVMLSFHGDKKVKAQHIARLKAHYKADEIIQGTYWENGKGCDTGCSFHSNDHSLWATELGIPEQIGYLRDKIFEGLPAKDAKEFPLQCSLATPVGVDLDHVWRKFMIWLLTDKKEGVIKYANTEAIKKCINDVSKLYADSLVRDVSSDKWAAAGAAAWAARDAARDAWAAGAAGAAWAAEAAEAAGAAWAARDAYYIRAADKLIELIKAA